MLCYAQQFSMQEHTEQVEIQEPAIREITHKRSCVRQTCSSGCGCIFLFLLASFLFLWFIIIPRPKSEHRLPKTFPESIPIYDQENIDSITIRTNDEQDPRIASLAIIPQYVLAPIVSYLDRRIVLPYLPGVREHQEFSNWVALVELLEHPEQTKIDSYIIHWTELDAEPSFIKEYYLKRLSANSYDITESNSLVSFEQEHITGTIQIIDQSPRPGTDEVRMSVYIERS